MKKFGKNELQSMKQNKRKSGNKIKNTNFVFKRLTRQKNDWSIASSCSKASTRILSGQWIVLWPRLPHDLHSDWTLFLARQIPGSEDIHILFKTSLKFASWLVFRAKFVLTERSTLLLASRPSSSRLPRPTPSFIWISSHEWASTLWSEGVMLTHECLEEFASPLHPSSKNSYRWVQYALKDSTSIFFELRYLLLKPKFSLFFSEKNDVLNKFFHKV